MYAAAPAVAYKASWRGFVQGSKLLHDSKSVFSHLPDGGVKDLFRTTHLEAISSVAHLRVGASRNLASELPTHLAASQVST
jgi:hypothetical protein